MAAIVICKYEQLSTVESINHAINKTNSIYLRPIQINRSLPKFNPFKASIPIDSQPPVEGVYTYQTCPIARNRSTNRDAQSTLEADRPVTPDLQSSPHFTLSPATLLAVGEVWEVKLSRWVGSRRFDMPLAICVRHVDFHGFFSLGVTTVLVIDCTEMSLLCTGLCIAVTGSLRLIVIIGLIGSITWFYV